jgi:hypothetical protein
VTPDVRDAGLPLDHAGVLVLHLLQNFFECAFRYWRWPL